MAPLSWYQILAAILFAIGVAGVLTRRNGIVILLSIELMLNASNLSFVAFSRQLGGLDGHVLALIVITMAAAEVAVGLAILLNLQKTQDTTNLEDIKLLRW